DRAQGQAHGARGRDHRRGQRHGGREDGSGRGCPGDAVAEPGAARRHHAGRPPKGRQALVTERTFFIVKPDAIRARALGKILAMIEASGLTVVAGRIRHLTTDEAQRFYAVHREPPFFGDLLKFMTSGRVFVGVLEGENAIKRWRDLMGPTDSKKAPRGTVRGEFGTDVEQNASHGSDAAETARAEIAFFFPGLDLPGA